MFTIGQNMENTCFYCYNWNPDLLPHWFRDQCPWYLHHVAMGIVHLNKDNRLCLGPIKEGALTLWLQYRRPQGEQVQLQTTSIEYNKFLDRQPKKGVSTLSNSVAGLTFVYIRLDNEDKVKEEIEGYRVVNVISITKANTTCIKKPEV